MISAGKMTGVVGSAEKAVKQLERTARQWVSKITKEGSDTVEVKGGVIVGGTKGKVAAVNGGLGRSAARFGSASSYAPTTKVSAKAFAAAKELAGEVSDELAYKAAEFVRTGIKAKKWAQEEVTGAFELLIEWGSPVVSHPKFRALLDRDENLFTNQLIREANGNIAYRSVDVEIDDLPDEEFWGIIDGTPYNELIENNAAVALFKNAEKLGIFDQE